MHFDGTSSSATTSPGSRSADVAALGGPLRAPEANRKPFVRIVSTVVGMAIARFPVVVLDCPDRSGSPRSTGPARLARGAWTTRHELHPRRVRRRHRLPEGGRLHAAPGVAGQDVPQQMHIDVDVDDLDTAGRRCSSSARQARAPARHHVPASSSTPPATRSASAPAGGPAGCPNAHDRGPHRRCTAAQPQPVAPRSPRRRRGQATGRPRRARRCGPGDR